MRRPHGTMASDRVDNVLHDNALEREVQETRPRSRRTGIKGASKPG